jgi:hypothetical protein
MRAELSTMATVCTFLAGALFAQTLVSEDSSACKAKWGIGLHMTQKYCGGLSGLIGCMLVVSLAINLLALVSAVLVQIFGSMQC